MVSLFHISSEYHLSFAEKAVLAARWSQWPWLFGINQSNEGKLGDLIEVTKCTAGQFTIRLQNLDGGLNMGFGQVPSKIGYCRLCYGVGRGETQKIE